MMWNLPGTERSTTVEPSRLWSAIGPPSTTTASLGHNSLNSYKAKIIKRHKSCTKKKTKTTKKKQTSDTAVLTWTASVLDCVLILALVRASGSSHIWHKRLMKGWSGIRTPTSYRSVTGKRKGHIRDINHHTYLLTCIAGITVPCRQTHSSEWIEVCVQRFWSFKNQSDWSRKKIFQ